MRKLLVIVLLFSLRVSFSQKDANIAKYFEQGNNPNKTSFIKTDISQILMGNFPIIYEHGFNKYFALQGGFGFLTNGIYAPFIEPIFKKNAINKNLKGGFSLMTQPMLYLFKTKHLYFSTPLRYIDYIGKASAIELCVMTGTQFRFDDFLLLDLSFGWGRNYEYTLNKVDYIYDKGVLDDFKYRKRTICPVSLKIGYIF